MLAQRLAAFYYEGGTMTKRDQEIIENNVKTITSLREILNKTKDELIAAKEELAHYRAAVSAVKWLWDQASKQREFQL